MIEPNDETKHSTTVIKNDKEEKIMDGGGVKELDFSQPMIIKKI